jgi:hypothetical protein
MYGGNLLPLVVLHNTTVRQTYIACDCCLFPIEIYGITAIPIEKYCSATCIANTTLRMCIPSVLSNKEMILIFILCDNAHILSS